MTSTTGVHFIALDHVRALAAFMVFSWHFIPSHSTPIILLCPISLLNQGHTGVALFMTLSGYLFAKLLDGKSVDYKAFIWNRALRLLPLLILTLLIVGIQKYSAGENMYVYSKQLLKGVVGPSLPVGAWSITVEFHYYLILPLFLWMIRKSSLLPIVIIVMAISFRILIYYDKGTIQHLAYNTLIGRIDQFVLGMIMYQLRIYLTSKHFFVFMVIAIFIVFYWHFDSRGGFYDNYPDPSLSPLWIMMPTIEGVVYATSIAWYETSFNPSVTGLSKFVGHAGEYSYSIYLLHLLFIGNVASFINHRVMDISNLYLACVWSLALFVLMMGVGYFSFRFIESPFLKLRKRYVL